MVDAGSSDAPDSLVQFAPGLDDPARDVDFEDMRDNQLDEVDSQSQSVLAPVAPGASTSSVSSVGAGLSVSVNAQCVNVNQSSNNEEQPQSSCRAHRDNNE